ncbi:MAG: glycoside hydrolase family 43 protein [bacterium]|nr:glycoside hydrolase family 43 protein [bacterium]
MDQRTTRFGVLNLCRLQQCAATTLVIVAALSLAGPSSAASDDSPRDITDGQRQLFLDDWVIAETVNVQREPGAVTKHPDNPVIRRDKPWDASRTDLYGSVVHDVENDRLQLFYSANNVPNGHEDRLGYAESLDGGETWVKPELDIIPYKEHARTNLVMLPPALVFAGPCVFIDRHETDPSKRYKLFTSSYPDTAYLGVPRIYEHRGQFLGRDHSAALPEGCTGLGMYVAYSPDGVHWNCSGKPFSDMLSDTTQSAFWDERLGKYVAYVRARTDNGRSVARMESDDFETWTDPKVVLEGNQNQSLYSMGVNPYQGGYIGTPWIFDQPSERAGGPVIWPELAYSRDGIVWTRLFPGTPFVPTGPKGTPDSRQIRLAGSFAVVKDRIVLMYGQTDKSHEDVDMQIDIGTATLRLDGFASMTAGDTPGHILTAPLRFDTGTLHINAQVESGGYVKAEVLDAAGNVLNGYAAGQCVPFQGDAIDAPLAWKGRAEVPANSRIRFLLRNARIYSFWIAP